MELSPDQQEGLSKIDTTIKIGASMLVLDGALVALELTNTIELPPMLYVALGIAGTGLAASGLMYRRDALRHIANQQQE